jgi:hypothetical protein
MRIRKPLLVASVGQYGPFDDGRTIRYVDFVDPEGGGLLRATFGQDLPADTELPLTSQGEADLELHATEKGLRLRLHGYTLAQGVRKAA